MNTQKIVSRFNRDTVLFECEIGDGIESSMAMRYALEKAVESRADLSDADLSGADLSGAYLWAAYLSGADLSGADLSGADLSGADLSDADLSGADLSGAHLIDAYLRGADLSDADLSGAHLIDAYLRGADLSGAYLRGAYLSGADLWAADLSGADLSGADLSGAHLSDADLSDADMAATPAESIANLDKVRAIILDDQARLAMEHWHEDGGWETRTCAEETLCNTTHCLAGWLQVCSADPKIRKMSAKTAGALSAPTAAKMFFRGSDEVISWLEERKYVAEIAKAEKRAEERRAKKASEKQG